MGRGDGAMRKALHNALRKALHKALRFARSEVVIDASLGGRHLVISIEDDGPGPGPAKSAPAGAGDSMASGLGTSPSRAVARTHRHDDVEGWVGLAQRPGGGARFGIALPRHDRLVRGAALDQECLFQRGLVRRGDLKSPVAATMQGCLLCP